MSGCPFSGAATAVAQSRGADVGVATPGAGRGRRSRRRARAVRHRRPQRPPPRWSRHPSRRPRPPRVPSAALTKLKKGRALKGAHGVGDPRGSDIALRFGRDREARFGVMFKRLPAYNPPDALLTALAVKMNDGKAPLNDVKDSDVAFDNETMPAGYIYLGQFIDHDMTLDKTPLTQQKQDPRAMTNYDTPKFDLGSVYGKGPTGSPELYDPAKPGLPAGQPARRAVRPAPRRRRRRLPRRPAQRREPDRGAAARGVPAHAQQADGHRQGLREGPAAAAVDLPVPDRQRLPGADLSARTSSTA